jgi:hypothetical protein
VTLKVGTVIPCCGTIRFHLELHSPSSSTRFTYKRDGGPRAGSHLQSDIPQHLLGANPCQYQSDSTSGKFRVSLLFSCREIAPWHFSLFVQLSFHLRLIVPDENAQAGQAGQPVTAPPPSEGGNKQTGRKGGRLGQKRGRYEGGSRVTAWRRRVRSLPFLD